MVKDKVYYEFYASVKVPNPEVGYWIDLNADPNGQIIKFYNHNLRKWVKLTDASGGDATPPYIGSNNNWWVENRDTGISAIGHTPYIGENGNWITWDSSLKKYVDTGIKAGNLLTKEDVEKALTGDVQSHTHDSFYYRKPEVNKKIADTETKLDNKLQEHITASDKEFEQLQENIEAVEQEVDNEIFDMHEKLDYMTNRVNTANENATAALNKVDAVEDKFDAAVNNLEIDIDKTNSKLSKEVTRLDNRINNLTSEITSDINELNEELDNLKEKHDLDINAVNTRITENKNIIDNYTVNGYKISSNPELNKSDVGLSQVDNTSDMNKPISTATQEALDKITSDVESHTTNKSNPHEVTKEQVGLSNVTNDAQVKRSEMGVASGIATLDESGKIPSSQLPSFVDDIIEADSLDEFPEVGEAGKIYLAKDTNIIYRWSGSKYVEVSSSLALGETIGTAYEGNKGKANRDAIVSLPDTLVSEVSKGVVTGDDVSLNINTASRSELNYAEPTSSTITIDSATSTTAGVMSAADKAKLDGIDANANAYVLPVATDSELGGIKVGAGLSVAADGTISTNVDLSDYATKEELGNYLPLIGGTLTEYPGSVSNNRIELSVSTQYYDYPFIEMTKKGNGSVPNLILSTKGLEINEYISDGPGYNLLAKYDDNGVHLLRINDNYYPDSAEYTRQGVTLRGKTSSDLLHAAGGTISIQNILSQVNVPTKISELTNDSGFQTATQVESKIAAIVDSAPDTLNTLNELAAAIGDDPNFSETVSSQINSKLDTSTYNTDKSTFALKSEIPSLDNYATEEWVEEQGYLTEHQDISNLATKSELATKLDTKTYNSDKATFALKTQVPTKVSQLTNDSSYVTKTTADASYQPKGSYATTTQLNAKQDKLVSGTNIKTVNGASLLGTGNIIIETPDGGISDAPQDGNLYGRRDAQWTEIIIPDISNLATKSEIPTDYVSDEEIKAYSTTAQADAKYQAKGNYLTSVSLATISDLNASWDALLKVAPPSTWATTWDQVSDKPSWIGASKPAYSYSEISGTPSSLKNPYALTLQRHGVSLGSYDGSSAKTFNITAPSWGEVTGKPTWVTATNPSYTKAEANNKYLLKSTYTAADILSKLKTVDSTGSGLDADLLDGVHASGLLTTVSSTSGTNLSITVGGTTKNVTGLYAKYFTPTRIAANTDLNSISIPGMYCCLANSIATTLENCPTELAFSLMVELHAGVKQTLTEYSTGSAKTWVRNSYAGNWGKWREIAFIDSTFSIVPVSDGIINFGGTGTSTTIYFGRDSADDRPVPTTYNFGRGIATIVAGNFIGIASSANKLELQDIRTVDTPPIDETKSKGLFYHLKLNTADGLDDGGRFHSVLQFVQWGDVSGGLSKQIALTDNGNMWLRNASSETEWGTWKKLAFISDNLASATKLQTPRKINGTSFDGTADIVTSYWGTARILSLTGNATGSASINGSSNVTMNVNVNFAASAQRLQTQHTIWGQSFNGAQDVTGSLSGVEYITMSGNIIFNIPEEGGYLRGTRIERLDGTDVYLAAAYGNSTRSVEYYAFGYSSGNDGIIIRNNNVGIGTTSPARKLDVIGSTGTTDLYINGIRLYKGTDGPLHVDGSLAVTGSITATELFTELSSTDDTNLSITIGGTTKTIADLHATSATAASSAGTALMAVTATTATSATRLDSQDIRDSGFVINEFASGLQVAYISNSTDSLSDGGTGHGVLNFKPYGPETDHSGSSYYQLGFTDNGNIWYRNTSKSGSSTPVWGSWRKLNVLGPSGLSGTGNFNWTGNFILDGTATTNQIYHSLTIGYNDTKASAKVLRIIGSSGTAGYQGAAIQLVNAYFLDFAKKWQIEIGGVNAFNGDLIFQNESDNDSTTQHAPYYRVRFYKYGSGNVAIAAAGSVSNTSDIKLKNRQSDLTNVLDKLNNISPFYFTWKDNKDSEINLGLSAQDIQEQFPEFVHSISEKDGEKILGLSYGEFGAVIAVAGLKELYSLIKKQQQMIENLQTEIFSLKNDKNI